MGIRKRFGMVALCALAGSTAALVAPQRASADVPAGVTVSYRDLQLSRPADARILYGRLQQAAERICVAPSPYELERYAAFQHCVLVTVRDAVARIHSSALDTVMAESSRTGNENSLTAQVRP